MRPIIKKLYYSSLVQLLLYYFIRLYSCTFRLTVENEKTWMDYYKKQNGAVLLCCYHQQFFSAIRYFKNYKPYQPGLMISRNRDGEIIAGVANRTGWVTVRGSSTRGGAEALGGMIEHLSTHRLAAHIVDGPRGPVFKVKPGAIRLAQKSNAVIVPFFIASDNAWYFKSWDKFLLPKPFSKVVLRYGDMIKIPLTETTEEFEAQRSNLDNIMYLGSEALRTSM